MNLGAIVPGSEIPEFRSFLLLSGQYRIEDNWQVAGLKGTGSKDIVVDELLVPEYRSQSHIDYAVGAPLPGQVHNDAPLYRLPWSVVFNMAIAASILGSARGFVEAWVGETRDRFVPGSGRLADDPLTQRRLADALWDLGTATTVLRADARGPCGRWRGKRHTATMGFERARLRWNTNRGCERVAAACTDLFRAASGRSVFLDHPLQSRFADLQAGLGHAFLVPDPLAKAVGGHLLGTTKPELVL